MTLEEMKAEMATIESTIADHQEAIEKLREQKRATLRAYMEANGADLIGQKVLFDPSRDGKFKLERAKIGLVTDAAYANEREGIKFEVTRLKQNGKLYSQPWPGLHPASTLFTYKLEAIVE